MRTCCLGFFTTVASCLVCSIMVFPAMGISASFQDAEKQESAQESDSTASTQETDKDENAGLSDLNLAFEKKISARTERDLAEVVQLCKSALEKGLTADGKKQATDLMVATLLENAEELAARIFGPEQDPRWRAFRGRAVRLMEQATEVDPSNSDSWLMLAKLQILPGGKLDVAAAAAEKAVELNAERPKQRAEALLVRAATATDNDKRLADFSEAITLDSENIEAIKARGVLLLQLNRTDEAIADFESWLTKEPNNVGAWVVILSALDEQEENDKAMELANKAIESNPDASILYSMRANLRMANDQLDEALADAGKAVELDENNVDALTTKATIFSQQEKNEEALATINKVIDKNKFDVRAIWIRGIIYSTMEDYSNALKDLTWLTENIPDNPTFKLQKAAILVQDKQPQKAIEIYDALIASEISLNEAYRSRGDTKLGMGQHKSAIEDYEALYKLTPEDSGLLNNFAWVLATSTFDDLRDGKRSVEMATKACELTEYKQAHILSTLGAAYAEIGDFDNAKKWAEKSIEASEDEEQIKGLKDELDSYLANKPWRENEGLESEDDKSDGELKSGAEEKIDPQSEKQESDDGQEKKDAGKNGKDGGDGKGDSLNAGQAGSSLYPVHDSLNF